MAKDDELVEGLFSMAVRQTSPAYNVRSLEDPDEDAEAGGFEYCCVPAIFGHRTGYGPLRIAWDTNVLSDYATYGAAMWEDEEFDPARLEPPVTEERHSEELVALEALMHLWLIRDIRLHVFAFQLIDARRRMPGDMAEVREYQLQQIAAALECLGHGSGVPDNADYLPPTIPVLPDTSDRRVLELAVDAGCHVMLTRDRRFKRRADAVARERGVALLEPTGLLDALAEAGELSIESLSWFPAPDSHKVVHVLPATEDGFHALRH